MLKKLIVITTLFSFFCITPIDNIRNMHYLQSSGEVSARGVPLVISVAAEECFILSGIHEMAGSWEIDSYDSSFIEVLPNLSSKDNFLLVKALKEGITSIKLSFKSNGQIQSVMAPWNTHQTVEVHICPKKPKYF